MRTVHTSEGSGAYIGVNTLILADGIADSHVEGLRTMGALETSLF
jgi:hypothetical protein